jgi:hypothetical protein
LKMMLDRTVHFIARKSPPGGWTACFWLENSARRNRGDGTERTKYNVAKDRLCSAPFVSMVQTAHLRNANDTTVLRSIDGPRLRGVFRQG